MTVTKHGSELYYLCSALSNQHRTIILHAIAKAGEICAYDLLKTINISQPTMSQHITVLRKAGLVVSRKEGRWKFFRVNTDCLGYIIDILEALKEKAETSLGDAFANVDFSGLSEVERQVASDSMQRRLSSDYDYDADDHVYAEYKNGEEGYQYAYDQEYKEYDQTYQPDLNTALGKPKDLPEYTTPQSRAHAIHQQQLVAFANQQQRSHLVRGAYPEYGEDYYEQFINGHVFGDGAPPPVHPGQPHPTHPGHAPAAHAPGAHAAAHNAPVAHPASAGHPAGHNSPAQPAQPAATTAPAGEADTTRSPRSVDPVTRLPTSFANEGYSSENFSNDRFDAPMYYADEDEAELAEAAFRRGEDPAQAVMRMRSAMHQDPNYRFQQPKVAYERPMAANGRPFNPYGRTSLHAEFDIPEGNSRRKFHGDGYGEFEEPYQEPYKEGYLEEEYNGEIEPDHQVGR